MKGQGFFLKENACVCVRSSRECVWQRESLLQAKKKRLIIAENG